MKILYGSYAVGVSKTKDKIDAVIIENKSGRQAITVNSVVDATGDCDIAYFAEAPTQTFNIGNVLAGWYYSLGENGYRLNTLGFAPVLNEPSRENNNENSLASKRFTGIDGNELSQMMQLSHSLTYNDIINHRKTDSTFIPTSIATIPQIRMTRKIIGEYILSNSEKHIYFEDSILI